MKSSVFFLFLILSINSLFGNTIFLDEDFENNHEWLWTMGTRSDAQAFGGKYSLASVNHQMTLGCGEGFFFVDDQPEKTRISFVIYSLKAESFDVTSWHWTKKGSVRYQSKLSPGKWTPVTVSLTDLKGEKKIYEPGDLFSSFNIQASDDFWIDQLRIESDLTGEEREKSRPQHVFNPIDLTKMSARIPLQVMDKQTGDPTAARIYVRKSDTKTDQDQNKTYMAHPKAWLEGVVGTPKDAFLYQLGEVGYHQKFFHTPGESLLFVEPGKIIIEAVKGLEYRYVTQELEVLPGDNKPIKLTLGKWTDLSKQGFFCGDAHIHPNYGQSIYLIEPADILLMAQAEDLNIVNAMVANAGWEAIFEWKNFTGKISPLSKDPYILYWSEEYRSEPYGHLCLWNLPKLIFPVHNGFNQPLGSPGYDDYPPNATILEHVHEMKGAASYHCIRTVSPNTSLIDKEEFNNKFTPRELPIDAALVGVDAIDVLGRNYIPNAMKYWWRLLNCNLRIPASAGTDAMPASGKSMLGMTRVYVKSGAPLDYDQWIEAYKKGRSFVTTGPVVWMTVNGKEPGEIMEGEKGSPMKLSIKADASSQFGLERIEIISMGNVISKVELQGQLTGALQYEMTVDANTWIVVQAFGNKPPVSHASFSTGQQYACTSPIYCDLKKLHPIAVEDAAHWVQWIDLLEDYLDQRNRYGNDIQKAAVKDLLKRGRDYYHQLSKKAADSVGSEIK